MNQSAVIDGLEKASQELAKATIAAVALLREISASQAQPEQWLRIPRQGERCPVSNWSRTTIYEFIDAGKVQSKRVKRCRFYSADDVRKLLKDS